MSGPGPDWGTYYGGRAGVNKQSTQLYGRGVQGTLQGGPEHPAAELPARDRLKQHATTGTT